MPWNTTPPSDRERIRKLIGMSAGKDQLTALNTAMEQVEYDAPEAVTTIQELLVEADALKAVLQTSYSSNEAGLIRKKIDALEWEWSEGTNLTANKESRMGQIRDEILNTLGLTPPEGSSNYGQATLERS